MKHVFDRHILILILTAGLVLAGCGNDSDDPTAPVDPQTNYDYTAEALFSETLDIVNSSQFTLKGVNGTIVISGRADANTINISGLKRVGANSREDAENTLPELEVLINKTNGDVIAETVHPAGTAKRSYTVDYSVALPDSCPVLVENTNGSISFESIHGSVTAKLANGQVRLADISGDTKATIINGIIHGDLSVPADGVIDLTVVNGSISLSIPRDTSSLFMATVSNGSITVDNLDFEKVQYAATKVHGTLGEGRGDISLASFNGDIVVTGY